MYSARHTHTFQSELVAGRKSLCDPASHDVKLAFMQLVSAMLKRVSDVYQHRP